MSRKSDRSAVSLRWLLRTFCFLALTSLLTAFSSCSKDDDSVRVPEDIIGIWKLSDTDYYRFNQDYTVRRLQIEYQDGESIGIWTTDSYLYEPGYQIVIYLSGNKADVYQIVDLTSNGFTWCWVEEVNAENAGNSESIGKIIGEIIKQAQEGFNLDPELFESFRKISEEEYLDIIAGLDLDL